MSAALKIMDAASVQARLSYRDCIPLMREAMIALSKGEVIQNLRSFLPVTGADGDRGTFAMMPAVMSQGFGAKLVSVYPDPDNLGSRRHQGVVVLFDQVTGAPVFVGDAEEITRIRTAAATAAATDALARADASILTIIGTGAQAKAHVHAISAVRPLTQIRLWGREHAKAQDMAAVLTASHQTQTIACQNLEEACDGAHIITTVTSAREPFLHGHHVDDGCHVNLVGSSGPTTAEAMSDLVAKGRFIVDHRDHVLAHGGEFLRANAQGLIDDTHIIGEIGQVLDGQIEGRTDNDQITIYKSLGHAAQDLAAAAWLLAQQ